MYKLINFAVKLMEKQNIQDPKLLPSQNSDINPTQNPNLKQNQWGLFKETILWNNLNEDQRAMCKRYLK